MRCSTVTLMLAAFTPSGDMRVLLGDFTGHGLPAAAVMPLAEVFYGHDRQGLRHGADPVARDERRFKRTLPVDMFCCAILLNLSVQRVRWKCGMAVCPMAIGCRWMARCCQR